MSGVDPILENQTATDDERAAALRELGIATGVQQVIAVAQQCGQLDTVLIDAVIEAVNADLARAKVDAGPGGPAMVAHLEQIKAGCLAVRDFRRVLAKADERAATRASVLQPGPGGLL